MAHHDAPSINALAERLIRCVSRAFYDDETVAVMDALIQHRFLRSSENTKLLSDGTHEPCLDSVLQLKAKQIRKVVTNLIENERLVKEERVGDGVYFYIDYSHFKNVVELRLAILQDTLTEQERLQRSRSTYRCPRCKDEVTALDFARSGVAHCVYCEGSGEAKQSECLLVEVDQSHHLKAVEETRKKFEAQLSAEDGLHDGIYDLLQRLGEACAAQGVHLTQNLPSNTMKRRGHEPTKRKNNAKRVRDMIDDDSLSRVAPEASDSSLMDVVLSNTRPKQGLMEDDAVTSAQTAAAPAPVTAKEAPAFLRQSQVEGVYVQKEVQPADGRAPVAQSEEPKTATTSEEKAKSSGTEEDLSYQERYAAFLEQYRKAQEMAQSQQAAVDPSSQADDQKAEAASDDDDDDEDIDWEDG